MATARHTSDPVPVGAAPAPHPDGPLVLHTPLADWSMLDESANLLRLATGRALSRVMNGNNPTEEQYAELRRLAKETLVRLKAALERAGA